MIGAIVAAMLRAAARGLPSSLMVSKRDVEILRVRDALRRHELRADEMADQTPRGVCCTGCYWGAEYNEVADQCERTRDWLIILLRKRGRSDDLAEAQRLGLKL